MRREKGSVPQNLLRIIENKPSDELCAAIPALKGMEAVLKPEVDTYRVAARSAPAMDHGDVAAFSTAVLEFWRTHGSKMPAWRKAAKIVFAIPPTSAASERVFSLLQAMFGKDQDANLSDLIQGATGRFQRRNALPCALIESRF